MTTNTYKIGEAAELLGVSDDTVRRWIDHGRIERLPDSGPVRIEGAELARAATELANATPRPVTPAIGSESARNRFVGVVTSVLRDTVMAQVDIQAGPHHLVSLISRQSADELGLEPGVRAVASIKSTNVVVELPVQA